MDTGETKIYLAVIITALVLGVIILYFAWTVIRQQKRNLALQRNTMLAEISVMEKERTRIAADLHDELGPVLSVIKFQVDYSRDSPMNEKDQLVKASEQLDGCLVRLREIANDLMPGALLKKGLVTALQEFITKVELTGKLKVHFEHEQEVQLGEDKAIHLYRVLQEVIHNTMRHSGASEMLIRLSSEDNCLLIHCRDSGKGFDTEAMNREGRGIGLNSMKNRIEILGGTFLIESKPGKGTALLFSIPC